MKALATLVLAAALAACTTTSPDVVQRGEHEGGEGFHDGSPEVLAQRQAPLAR